MYADDLAVSTQSTDFAPIEETLTSALVGLSEYYKPTPRESDKDATAESRMWQTAHHQLKRCEPDPLQPPGVSWCHTRQNVVI